MTVLDILEEAIINYKSSAGSLYVASAEFPKEPIAPTRPNKDIAL
jgi:hypothetical protein